MPHCAVGHLNVLPPVLRFCGNGFISHVTLAYFYCPACLFGLYYGDGEMFRINSKCPNLDNMPDFNQRRADRSAAAESFCTFPGILRCA